ncbi:MAG: MoxR family ATPase [Lachnospiraceae bacterium]|nr:MoxR family ATPase [Lachnospiraceae bacterium]
MKNEGTRDYLVDERIMQLMQMCTDEVKKAIIGKDEVIRKVMTAILAGGHVLMEDVPGTGKTTLALAFAKVLSLDYRRMQFTPDVLPSDVTGFYMFNKKTDEFEFREGAIMCNLFLADEINRTSPKTQSALLEAMAEGNVTVDGVTHELPRPFFVIATENPLGSEGTSALPESQLDRFMMKLYMGYPSQKDECEILKANGRGSRIREVASILSEETLAAIQETVNRVIVRDEVVGYITRLVRATRDHRYVRLGLSTRAALNLQQAAKAAAFLEGRLYVMPEDVRSVFRDVANHRVILERNAKYDDVSVDSVIGEVLELA